MSSRINVSASLVVHSETTFQSVVAAIAPFLDHYEITFDAEGFAGHDEFMELEVAESGANVLTLELEIYGPSYGLLPEMIDGENGLVQGLSTLLAKPGYVELEDTDAIPRSEGAVMTFFIDAAGKPGSARIAELDYALGKDGRIQSLLGSQYDQVRTLAHQLLELPA